MGPPHKRLASYRIGFAHREDLDFNLSLEGTRRENTRGGGHPEYGVRCASATLLPGYGGPWLHFKE